MAKETGRQRIYVIRDLEQVRALAKPLCLRIIEALAGRSMTTTQLAKLLNDTPSNIDSHVKKLEHVGLIRPVKTKRKGKYYQTLAESFYIDRALFRLDQKAFIEIIEAILASTSQEVIESTKRGVLKPAEPQGYITIHKRLHGRREEIEALYGQIRALLRQCEAMRQRGGGKRGEDKSYVLTLIFYPVTSQTEWEQTAVQL